MRYHAAQASLPVSLRCHMTRRRIVLLALVAAGLAAAAGPLTGWWSWTRPAAEVPPAELVVAPHALDFGEVWATDRFDWSLPVQNTTVSEATLEALTGD